MWDKIKELYADGFLIATTGWLLLHLILIELYGVVRITEPNKWILWIEIVFAIMILLLAIERLIRDIRGN